MAGRVKNSLPITRIPDAIWAPVAAGTLIAITGFIGIAAGMPWLFPSLGPTAYLQTETPDKPSARFYNTVAGHMMGLVSGFAAVAVFNAWDAPSVLTTHQLIPIRVWAASLALALTLLGNLLLRASHPPSGATTLLVALGTFRTGSDVLTIVAGVLILAVLGVLFRKIRTNSVKNRIAML